MSVWTAADCRGVAGYVNAEQRALLDATWSYNWSLPDKPDPTWVPMAKLDGSQGWMTDAALRRAAAANLTGYWLLGNEPELAGIGMSSYCKRVAYAMKVIREVKPGTQFIVGGWLAWSPQMGSGASLPAKFWTHWRRQRRDPSLVAGIHFHSYKWKGRSLKDDTQRFMSAARAAWLGRELWITECGSLQSTSRASSAMAEFGTAFVGADRFAFFVSYEGKWAYTSLLTASGELTALGTQYRNHGLAI